jgi:hypothetical protein
MVFFEKYYIYLRNSYSSHFFRGICILLRKGMRIPIPNNRSLPNKNSHSIPGVYSANQMRPKNENICKIKQTERNQTRVITNKSPFLFQSYITNK